jgi:hypothetical protein
MPFEFCGILTIYTWSVAFVTRLIHLKNKNGLT